MPDGVGRPFYQHIEEKNIHYVTCWLKLNVKPKWQTLYNELKNSTNKMKNNDDSNSHQSIGLDDNDVPSGGAAGDGTVTKRKCGVMGKK